MHTNDAAFLDMATTLAEAGEGFTTPNPPVGCVIVRDGTIVGSGYHRRAGLPHAEVEALAVAGAAARGATAYVTLEPCAHFGRTPPCADALLAAGIARVVYAVRDPNDLARGGADRLCAAGIAVAHMPRPRATVQLRPWCFAQAADRVYVIAKFAGSLDGAIALPSGEARWITGPAARAAAHLLRQRTDAIMVGVGTVLADDPSLDPRPTGRTPAPSLKVVLDSAGRTPPTARLFSSPGPVLIAVTDAAPASRLEALRDAGAEVLIVDAENGHVAPHTVLKALRARGLNSVLVEGGGKVLGSMMQAALVDELHAFIAPRILGAGRSPFEGLALPNLAAAPRLHDPQVGVCGEDLHIWGEIRREAA